ncbi:TIGR02117 family protein [Manganibacter manganicus]|uniref:Urease-associated protein n=1 Tax=Manganibacter manganicus TaxID=1873176 RepID=A0A1V8RMM5_9HYPH|nr:TIGR02117 family protein [Pseudaminobacter manganicus]OQM74455.1 urease-associated protein [Pseudaminobacter manganicus]
MRSRFLNILAVGIALVVVSVIIGTITPRPIWRNRVTGPADATRQILLLSNPIHTDIAIPVDDAVRAQFGFLPAAGLPIGLPQVRYVIFGWGGRAFYTETPTWSELKAVPTFKGLTLDNSVMHVEIAGDIDRHDPSVTVVNITNTGMIALADAIRDSFADGPKLLAGLSYGKYDAFFEAKGYFNALFGCNTWTAAMLRRAGLSTGWWEPLPLLLRTSLQLHNDPASFAR